MSGNRGFLFISVKTYGVKLVVAKSFCKYYGLGIEDEINATKNIAVEL